MRKKGEYCGIDWSQEYAGCAPPKRAAPRRGVLRRGRLAVVLAVDAAAALLAGVALAWVLGGGGLALPAPAEGWAAGPVADPAGAPPAGAAGTQGGQTGGPGPSQVGEVAGYAGGAEPSGAMEPEAEQAVPPPDGVYADAIPAGAFGGAAGAAKAWAGAEVLLPVTPVYQNPELPNGCEASALAALLGYHGFSADKLALAYDYIPRQDFGGSTAKGARTGPSPAKAYAGDPTGIGFYCFAGPVAEGANLFLSQAGSALACEDITGADGAELEALLDAGTPVLLWVTLDYTAAAHSAATGWTLPNGQYYVPFSNLHCVVLCGYDDSRYILCDPRYGETAAEKTALLAGNAALGGHAAVIR